MKESEDFYIDPNGNYVFTEAFHLKRGYCCKNGCRHCPYNFKRKFNLDNDQDKGNTFEI